MKKTQSRRKPKSAPDHLRREYRLDYRKARRNRFAAQYRPENRVVVLDPDIAEVFRTPESVNTALRALIQIMPR